MEAQVHAPQPRVLDTYALVYGFSMVLLVPALFVIDHFGFEPYEAGFLALVLPPFVVGLVATFLTDSGESLVERGKRILVLTPLSLFGGLMILFVAAIAIVIPVSIVLVPENFDVLTPFFAASLLLLAAPMILALLRRLRGPFGLGAVVQMGALVGTLAVVAWTLVMTFEQGNTLGTFLPHYLLDYFSGAMTWFLPSIGLAAGIWRKTGLV